MSAGVGRRRRRGARGRRRSGPRCINIPRQCGATKSGTPPFRAGRLGAGRAENETETHYLGAHMRRHVRPVNSATARRRRLFGPGKGRAGQTVQVHSRQTVASARRPASPATLHLSPFLLSLFFSSALILLFVAALIVGAGIINAFYFHSTLFRQSVPFDWHCVPSVHHRIIHLLMKWYRSIRRRFQGVQTLREIQPISIDFYFPMSAQVSCCNNAHFKIVSSTTDR